MFEGSPTFWGVAKQDGKKSKLQKQLNVHAKTRGAKGYVERVVQQSSAHASSEAILFLLSVSIMYGHILGHSPENELVYRMVCMLRECSGRLVSCHVDVLCQQKNGNA